MEPMTYRGSGVKMRRIPEKELMDDIIQARAYAETDFSEPHNAFVAYFRDHFPDFTTGEVLDLGCGTADVILRFARAFPEVHITGIDGAQAMLDIALKEVQKQGLSGRISLEKCRLPDEDLLRRRFDAVISNSLLHHMADPAVMWQTMLSCARPGAPLFVMDLFRPDSIESARELVKQYASDAPPVLQEDFYNSLLAAYTVEEIESQLKTAGLGYLSVEVVSDRHMIIWGRRQA